MLKCVHTFMLGFSSFMTIEKVQHTGPPCKATIEDGSPLVAIVTQKDGWLDAYIACNASACRYSTGTGRFHVHTGPGLVHRSFSWWPASPWCLFSWRTFPTTLVAKSGQASLLGTEVTWFVVRGQRHSLVLPQLGVGKCSSCCQVNQRTHWEILHTCSLGKLLG